jgi:hypothetical protein
MLTTRFATDSRVTIHGRWRLKNVRVSSRLMPLNGRLNENQNSAVETWCVDEAPNAPRS